MWLQRLSDIDSEYRRREQCMEELVRAGDIPFNHKALDLVRANQHIAHYAQPGHVYCRYGDLRWMRDFLERGELLLSPASYYQGSEHGVARRDNEMEIETIVTPYDYDLGMVHASLLAAHGERAWAFFRHQKPCDHYLFCVTVGFDFRHFLDFGSDGEPAEECVLIRDQQAFEQRLLAGMQLALPGWDLSFGGAKYVDPYWILQALTTIEHEIFYLKNFRFMYQNEFRGLAMPPLSVSGPFKRIPIALGSLEDIAELIQLRRPPSN
jgi:hypothetical protein